MNNLVILKSSKGHVVINVDHISSIAGSLDTTTNKISLIITLSTGQSISVCRYTSKDNRSIMNRIIEKLYEQIIYRDSDEINMEDIVISAKKEIEKDEEDK